MLQHQDTNRSHASSLFQPRGAAAPFRRRLAPLLLSGLLLAAAGCVTTQPERQTYDHPPTFDRLVQQFEVVSFGTDFSDAEIRLSRWTRDIRFAANFPQDYPKSPAEAGVYAELPEHLSSISEATGIRFTAAEPKRADLWIDLAYRGEFYDAIADWVPQYEHTDVVAATSACTAIYKSFGGGILQARILIGRDIDPDRRRSCILEEVVQAMGLPKDACRYRPSLFCELDRIYRLTRADLILLRTLYDPRLRPGMSKADAMPIARQIIREHWTS